MMVILIIPLVCGLMVVVVYDVIVGGIVSALPDWAQTPAVNWMMDIPQGSDYIPGGPLPGACDNGQGVKMGSTRIDWVDYSDPAAADIHADLGDRFKHGSADAALSEFRADVNVVEENPRPTDKGGERVIINCVACRKTIHERQQRSGYRTFTK